MGWRFVRQPNGLLARFSDVVDDFTHYDMTEEEAVEEAREDLGREAAIKKVKAGVEDYEPWTNNVKGDGLSRWRDCLESIESVHGKEKLAEVERTIGRKDDDGK